MTDAERILPKNAENFHAPKSLHENFVTDASSFVSSDPETNDATPQSSGMDARDRLVKSTSDDHASVSNPQDVPHITDDTALPRKPLTRRQMLKLSAGAGVAAFLAACGAPASPSVKITPATPGSSGEIPTQPVPEVSIIGDPLVLETLSLDDQRAQEVQKFFGQEQGLSLQVDNVFLSKTPAKFTVAAITPEGKIDMSTKATVSFHVGFALGTKSGKLRGADGAFSPSVPHAVRFICEPKGTEIHPVSQEVVPPPGTPKPDLFEVTGLTAEFSDEGKLVVVGTTLPEPPVAHVDGAEGTMWGGTLVFLENQHGEAPQGHVKTRLFVEPALESLEGYARLLRLPDIEQVREEIRAWGEKVFAHRVVPSPAIIDALPKDDPRFPKDKITKAGWLVPQRVQDVSGMSRDGIEFDSHAIQDTQVGVLVIDRPQPIGDGSMELPNTFALVVPEGSSMATEWQKKGSDNARFAKNITYRPDATPTSPPPTAVPQGETTLTVALLTAVPGENGDTNLVDPGGVVRLVLDVETKQVLRVNSGNTGDTDGAPVDMAYVEPRKETAPELPEYFSGIKPVKDAEGRWAIQHDGETVGVWYKDHWLLLLFRASYGPRPVEAHGAEAKKYGLGDYDLLQPYDTEAARDLVSPYTYRGEPVLPGQVLDGRIETIESNKRDAPRIVVPMVFVCSRFVGVIEGHRFDIKGKISQEQGFFALFDTVLPDGKTVVRHPSVFETEFSRVLNHYRPDELVLDPYVDSDEPIDSEDIPRVPVKNDQLLKGYQSLTPGQPIIFSYYPNLPYGKKQSESKLFFDALLHRKGKGMITPQKLNADIVVDGNYLPVGVLAFGPLLELPSK